MEAFAVFEGGGVRGLGLVGALDVATNNYDYRFLGVAGTSAGAIIAVLYAGKWPMKSLIEEIKKKQFVDFLDGFSFDEAKKGIEELSLLCQEVSKSKWKTLKACKQFALKSRNLRSTFARLVDGHGVFDGDNFVRWMNIKLARYVKDVKGPVTFDSLAIPLKVITTDVITQQPIVYSRETSPRKSVAEAVRASISIPFFFKPIIDKKNVLVDGGLMSNFPAWVFDEERKKIPVALPTIGFRLVEEGVSNTIDDIFSLGLAVLWTGLGAYKQLQTRAVDNLIEIPIPTKGVSFVDFDLSDRDKELLFLSGQTAAHNVLSQAVRPKPASIIELQLEAACNSIKAAVGNHIHLRANIFLPSTGGRVKIFYRYNMDADSDRELEFPIDAGVTGRCWTDKEKQVVDLGEVRQNAANDPSYLVTKWKFRPQDHAAVRTTLNSLLSFPIRSPQDYSTGSKTGSILGVLNFDSDNTLDQIGLNKPDVSMKIVEIATRYSEVIATLLMAK